MIRLDGVTKRYPRTGEAVSDVSFRIGKGEFAFLTGASGAGKTTVLRLIHMQTPPDEGVVRVSRFSSEDIQRKEIPELRRRVSYVFQDFRLLEDLTAAENVGFALEATGTPRRKVADRVQKLLGHVGLAAKARSHPGELSGGQRQRVAIARALATDPLVLLADEPTGNLDDRAARGVFELLREINDLGMAVLFATHDTGLIRSHPGIRVLELEHGELVYDSARPEEPEAGEAGGTDGGGDPAAGSEDAGAGPDAPGAAP